VDGTLPGAVDATLQFGQKILAGSAANLARGAVEGRVTSTIALRLATGFLAGTLSPSLLAVVNLNQGDYRLSARLDWELRGAVTVSGGADVFAGPVDTLYGQFHGNDRVYLELTWQF
jgi:hypothetical protein